ncbi:long-chain-fatty-acid--CoA ligase [Actinomycetospora termitidis]|uniref:Long-chain-fatty-acid--CoA ligase n=1 Tax=Actinomycetospora termitidis TaxID=3053470 RepID=A0ABT7MGC1_9PSEU|nr:long-chain-fatty-acid--CoA ligase [Actinomycetospora sp. Odt1-22]MDL5159728.1 long-chain-fatty-acid--CoA ligase [Actinomycetospora sp. Odt1-22]
MTGSITGRGMTMSDMVARGARQQPDVLAFVDAWSRRTYREIDDRVTRLGNALLSRGVAPGDRVAVLGRNSTEVVEAWLAVLRIGGIAVPVNFRMVADEIAYVLADCGAVAVLCDEAFTEVLDDARRSAPEVRVVVSLGDDLAGVLAEASDTYRERPVADDDAAYVMYTSGTTGAPKGAVLTHRNLYLHAFCSMASLGLEGDDRVWMSAAPLFHIAGLSGMLPALITGGTVVIPPSGSFDPAATVATLVEEGVTSCFMVPAQWQAVCALPDLATRDLSRLRRISWGAAPASTTLLRTMIDAFPRAEVCTAFGQTECSPVTTYLRGEDSIRKIGSIGTPMVGVEVRVVDDEMVDVPRGTVGEIVYRSPMVMSGYWNKPEETAEAFRGGWFHSGDLVREDEDGYLFVVDRLKDMIISGGENIYCAEVENALAAHPKIAEVALIGVPDPRWGETPLAVVVARDPGDVPTDVEIEAFAREHLAAYKRPRHVRQVDALPRNPGGKVVKKTLRERFGQVTEPTLP